MINSIVKENYTKICQFNWKQEMKRSNKELNLKVIIIILKEQINNDIIIIVK
jgi:hypothetical protein